MITEQDLKQAALASGIAYAAVLDTAAIRFHEGFRQACERNVCGRYDTSWMGPPAIGPIEELKNRVLDFRKGLLLQTVHRTSGSFDWKGMMAAAENHKKIFRDFLKKVKSQYPEEDLLPLDAGCCSYCETCAYQDREPCRNPEEAVSSVEAYGMDVASLMKTAGMPSSHGKGTLGFVGLILFDPAS